jgi:hypothetical protein
MDDFKNRRRLLLAASGAALLPVIGTASASAQHSSATALSTAASGTSSGIYNVLDYGADPSGVSDSTSAINSAIAAMSQNGGTLYFPAGTYLISSQITLKSGRYLGDGPYSTFIKTASTTAGIFTDGGNSGVTIDGFAFTANAQNTSGSFVSLSGFQCNLINFRMMLYFIGVTHSGIASLILNGDMNAASPTSNSTIGLVLTGLDILVEDVVIDSGANPTQAWAAVQIGGGGGAVFLSHCDFLRHQYGLLINESNASEVLAPYCDNCYFDSHTSNAINLCPGGTTKLLFMHFNACWFASTSGFGVLLDPGPNAYVSGVTFNGCHFVNNSNHALVLNNANVNNIVVDGCLFANSQTITNIVGIYATSNVGNFYVNNSRFGKLPPFQPFGIGILLNAGCNNYIISNNDLTGSTQAAISVQSGAGANGIITNNLGYGPFSAQATVGGSPWTYTAGPAPETHYISGGSISGLTVQNLDLPYNSALTTIQLGPNESYTLVYSTEPAVKYVIH